MKPEQKDRIDALVDNLDTNYFRMGAADTMLGGSTYGEIKGYVNDVRGLFETPGGKAAKDLFYENLHEVGNAELQGAIEDAAIQWQNQEDSFSILLGYVLGLRIAGIDSERTKAMARTWRLGYPQD